MVLDGRRKVVRRGKVLGGMLYLRSNLISL